MRQGVWQSSSIDPERNTIGRVLHGRTLGIWGYGRIGQLVARYANAFGMQVMVWGSETSRTLAREHGLTIAQSKEELFMQSDVLSLHLRLSETTRHIVTAHELELMKTDALIVNTSRAELIAPNALEQSLKAGRPGAAAVDVYESEPISLPLALLRLENVLATPHIGFVEQDSYERYFRPAFEAVRHFVHGRPVKNIATKA
jgi:D-3-phosphoglycerate dehydrogenase